MMGHSPGRDTDIGKLKGFVLSRQNEDCGFRRSIYGGISTLENTYYAVECLRHMNALD